MGDGDRAGGPGYMDGGFQRSQRKSYQRVRYTLYSGVASSKRSEVRNGNLEFLMLKGDKN